jgi:peptidoglycan hydrolase-like protein with peptidoglycan-binding domain
MEDDIENISSVLNAGSPGKWSIVNGKENRKRGYAMAVATWPLGTSILSTDGRAGRSPEQDAPANRSQFKVLKRGDVGDDVLALQVSLSAAGYPVGDPDGSFGTLTEKAVVLVQHEHGLPVTGIVDEATMGVIRITSAERLPRADMTERDLENRGSRTYDQAKEVTLWGKVLGWLGFGTSGTVAAESYSPGSVTQFVSMAPKVAGVLTSPDVIKLIVIGAGLALLVAGIRMAINGRSIIGYRLEDARSGKHIGR